MVKIMDEVRGIGPRERLLENKDRDGEVMTSAEINELDTLRNQREAQEDVKREQARRERADRLAARRGNGGAVE
jgi:hypothetical protein